MVAINNGKYVTFIKKHREIKYLDAVKVVCGLGEDVKLDRNIFENPFEDIENVKERLNNKNKHSKRLLTLSIEEVNYNKHYLNKLILLKKDYKSKVYFKPINMNKIVLHRFGKIINNKVEDIK